MTELLAPAGNMEALRAAVSNGCDAVYLGLEKFGARAYSDNFTIDSLAEAIRYAHLRDVKIYVTMNTIVFEDEICDMRQQLDALNGIGVDGIIVQDLAVFDYVAANFADMEVHCSTQMGVDDLEGTMLLKEMGADRVVLAREVDLADVKKNQESCKDPHRGVCSRCAVCFLLRKLPYVRPDRIPERQPGTVRGILQKTLRTAGARERQVLWNQLSSVHEGSEHHRSY